MGAGPSGVFPRLLHRALHNEALVLARSGALDDALERELAALVLDGSDVEPLVVAGKLYAQKAMYARAIECWQAALRLDPGNARARAGIARATTLQSPRKLSHRLRKLAPLGTIPLVAIIVLSLVVTGYWPSYNRAVLPLETTSKQQIDARGSTETTSDSASSVALPRASEAPPAIKGTASADPTSTALTIRQNVASVPTVEPSVAASPEITAVASQRVPTETPVPSEWVAGPAAKPAVEHVVRPGETLRTIAAQDYGDIEAWQKIYMANRQQVPDPNVIRPGQVLQIPR